MNLTTDTSLEAGRCLKPAVLKAGVFSFSPSVTLPATNVAMRSWLLYGEDSEGSGSAFSFDYDAGEWHVSAPSSSRFRVWALMPSMCGGRLVTPRKLLFDNYGLSVGGQRTVEVSDSVGEPVLPCYLTGDSALSVNHSYCVCGVSRGSKASGAISLKLPDTAEPGYSIALQVEIDLPVVCWWEGSAMADAGQITLGRGDVKALSFSGGGWLCS